MTPAAIVPGYNSNFLHQPALANTYIDRSVEEIRMNREIAEYLDQQTSAYRNYTYLSIAALVAAAGAALFITGIFAPVYLPLTTISIFCLIKPAQELINDQFAEPYIQFKTLAQRTRDIGTEYLTIPNTPKDESFYRLIYRIPQGQYQRYKPLIAACNYWNRRQMHHETNMRENIHNARQQQRSLDQAVEYYLNASQERMAALQCKIQKAFLLAVAWNPQFVGSEHDLFNLNNLNIPADRNANIIHTDYNANGWALNAILQDFGDKRANAFIVFKTIPETISLTEAGRLSEFAIAHRIEKAIQQFRT